MNTLKLIVIAIFACASANEAYTQKKEKDKVLANKVYTVDFIETGEKKTSAPIPDEISFKGDKLNSKFMTAENKLPPSLYTVSVDSTSGSKVITFKSESKNDNGEELKWEGVITDAGMEGKAVISKKGKTKKEYSFIGTPKAKSEKK